ncbi:hypothetical protein F5051DRAFT_447403 [Lentinula edodes]|nr:hypothetical protein F5051DRAFT_447403 [Lentinula edodes]
MLMLQSSVDGEARRWGKPVRRVPGGSGEPGGSIARRQPATSRWPGEGEHLPSPYEQEAGLASHGCLKEEEDTTRIAGGWAVGDEEEEQGRVEEKVGEEEDGEGEREEEMEEREEEERDEPAPKRARSEKGKEREE